MAMHKMRELSIIFVYSCCLRDRSRDTQSDRDTDRRMELDFFGSQLCMTIYIIFVCIYLYSLSDGCRVLHTYMCIHIFIYLYIRCAMPPAPPTFELVMDHVRIYVCFYVCVCGCAYRCWGSDHLFLVFTVRMDGVRDG